MKTKSPALLALKFREHLSSLDDAVEPFVHWKAHVKSFLEKSGASALLYAFNKAVKRLIEKNIFNNELATPTHGNQTLSKDDELKLAMVLRNFSLCGAELSPQQACVMVFRVFKKNVNRKWFKNFIQRHSHLLRTSSARPMPVSRTHPTIRDGTLSFVEAVNALQRNSHLSPQTVANTDATILFAKDDKIRMVRPIAAEKRGGATDFGEKLGAMQPWVMANGDIVLVGFCWKVNSKAKTSPIFFSKKTRVGGLRNAGEGHEQIHFFSSTGAFTAEMMAKMAKLFIETLALIRGQKQLETFIFLDNCSYQRDRGMLEHSLEHFHHFIYLPPNTTAVLQPLDVVPFAAFKTILKMESDNQKFYRKLMGYNNTLKEALAGAVFTSLRTTFTKQVIVAGFRMSAILPWQPEVIKNRAEAVIVDEKKKISIAKKKLSETEKDIQALAAAAVKPLIKPQSVTSLRLNVDRYKSGITTTMALSEAKQEEKKIVTKSKSKNAPKSRQNARKKEATSKRKRNEDDEYSASGESYCDEPLAMKKNKKKVPSPNQKKNQKKKKEKKVLAKEPKPKPTSRKRKATTQNEVVRAKSSYKIARGDVPSPLQQRSENTIYLELFNGNANLKGGRVRRPKIFYGE